jgi:hypothetical protein
MASGVEAALDPCPLAVTAFLDRRYPEASASPNIDALRRSASSIAAVG